MQCNLAISALYTLTLPGSHQVKKKFTGHIQPTWLWQFENTAHSISSFLPLYLSRMRYIAIIIGLKPLKTSPLLGRDIHVFWYFVSEFCLFIPPLLDMRQLFKYEDKSVEELAKEQGD